MKHRDLVAHLSAHGCVLIRQGRRHEWWGNPASGYQTAVPRHTEIKENMVRRICEQLGVPRP